MEKSVIHKIYIYFCTPKLHIILDHSTGKPILECVEGYPDRYFLGEESGWILLTGLRRSTAPPSCRRCLARFHHMDESCSCPALSPYVEAIPRLFSKGWNCEYLLTAMWGWCHWRRGSLPHGIILLPQGWPELNGSSPPVLVETASMTETGASPPPKRNS